MGPDFPFQLAHSTGSVTNPCSHLAGSGRLRAFYEHEPLNFFGYRPARVDIGEMSAKRRHSLIELRVGQARQEGIGTQCRFMDEAWPVRSDGFYDDLMVPRRKAGGDKFAITSSHDGKSASSMARTAGKNFGTTTSFSRVPVRMQT
jgi:hypothetical protein